MNASKILDYVSGRRPDLADEVEAWISESESNRNKYYEIRQLWAVHAVGTHSDQASLDNAVASIRNRIYSGKKDTRYRRRLALAWGVAAALAVVVAIGVGERYLPAVRPVVVSNEASEVFRHSLPDGSTVFLKKGASIAYRKNFRKDERRLRLKGEAYFDISRDESRPFSVETACTGIRVLGTSFNVASFESTEVVLEKGRVQLCDSNGNPVADLHPGERAVVGKDGNVSLSAVRTGEYTGWRYNYQVYDKCTFDDFVLIVENRFDVRFVYDPMKFKDTYFRLTLSESDSLGDILDMMDYIAHIKYERNGRNIYVDKR
ncbi:MAG: FecR family protein [Candidatus Cryptobacteroides sp.]